MEHDNQAWADARLAELAPPANWHPSLEAGRAKLRNELAPRRAAWPWATAAAVVIAASALAFPAPRALAERCAGACVALFTKASGPAPESLADAGGTQFRIADYKGKVVLLNFWATWCPPCKAEMPWFEEFERKYAARGFAAIGIAMDDDGWKPVRPLIGSMGIHYRIALGNAALARQYGEVESLPETILIGRDGRVAARHSGLVGKQEYEDEIRRLLE